MPDDLSSRMRRALASLKGWLFQLEFEVLLALLVVSGGTWVFLEVTDAVLEGEAQAFDEWVVLSLRRPDDPAVPIGPEYLFQAGRDITALGGTVVLVLLLVLLFGYLWLDRRRRTAVLLAVIGASGFLVSHVLKSLFARPRPEIVRHLDHVQTASFPSGHAMMAAVIYSTLAVMLAAVVKRRRLRLYVLFSGAMLALLVGCTRVYLGVHYPTDVVAGLAIGAAWAMLSWTVARVLQARRVVEAPHGERQRASDG